MDELYRYLAAKNDPAESKWIPLWVHCLDTYNVMKYLLSQWKNSGALNSITRRISEETIWNTALFLALFHDYGKASMAFQARILEGCFELKRKIVSAGLDVPLISDPELRLSGELPHGAAGEVMLLINGCPASLAAVVGAHHGKPWAKGTDIGLDIEEYLHDDPLAVYKELNYGLCLWGGKSRREVWLETQKTFFNWALSVLPFESLDILQEINDSEAVILSGFVIMADWLASNENYFPLISYGQMKPDNMEERESRIAERIQLPPSWHPYRNNDIRALSIERFGFQPNEIQETAVKAVIESADPGLMILEAPMGIGKTEAALLAAEEYQNERISGLLFALPTQATANGILPRVVEWGEKQPGQNVLSIRLAHSMAVLNEEYSSIMERGKHAKCEVDDFDNTHLVVHDFFQGSKQALLADFVISTIDQVLLASLKQKHFMLRHLGLSGKVVIIDECHAYDAYMNEYLERTLEWLGEYHTPVIMLSATLPYERRAAFIDAYLRNNKSAKEDAWRKTQGYPLLTWTDKVGVHQKEIPYSGIRRDIKIIKTDIDGHNNDTQEVVKILKDNLRDGGCAAVILNTVRRAQEMAAAVTEAFPDRKVILLHSRFIAEDRQSAENVLLEHLGRKSSRENRDDCIVIGTQVIEQSLDFDVDLMITDLCPMDLLLQRIGRLHRHIIHDEDRPEVLKKAKCYVLDSGEKTNKGNEAVYGKYLLMRTDAMLPDRLILPDDISMLVQNVYDDTVGLEIEPEGYSKAKREFQEKRNKEKKDADAFRLIQPGKERTINHFLDAVTLADEERANAQVRNGDMSFEVIALFQSGVRITRAPWRYYDSFETNNCPAEGLCRAISNQRLRLPSWVVESGIQEELRIPDAWKESAWLNGKRLLVFDENGDASINNIQAHYDRKYGLRVERRESV